MMSTTEWLHRELTDEEIKNALPIMRTKNNNPPNAPAVTVVRVRSLVMLIAYAKVVKSIEHLNDEERRRVMKAANITCGVSL